MSKRIAVLGAGAVGCGVAASAALKGFEVSLYQLPAFGDLQPFRDIQTKGGIIRTGGDLDEGEVKVSLATTELAEAVSGADLILVATQSGSHQELAEGLAGLVSGNQTVFLFAGSCGSLIFARIFRERAGQSGVLIGEASVAGLGSRVMEDNRVVVSTPMKLRSGAFPAKRTHEMVEQLNDLLPAYGVTNVLAAGLHNPNALIHVPQVLLNYGAIERGLEGFSLRTDGTTPTVLRLMDIMDEERRRLCQEMGIKPILIDDMYTEMDSTPDIYRKAAECMNVPYRFLPRYLDEDIAFDLVLWWSLGKQFGVELPLVDAFITLSSLITGGNYREIGRTPDQLGIADMNAKQVQRYLEEGVE